MERIMYQHCPGCGAAAILPRLTAKDHTVSGKAFAIWQCDACTLRFTQQAPAMSSIGEFYRSENYISHTDTKKGLVNSLYHLVRNRTLQQKKRMIAQVTGIQKGNLLDVGAGTGAFCACMQQAGWAVTGLEPDEATRRRAMDLHGLALQTTDGLFQLPDASFDAVTLWHVLEHVHPLHEYLRQIKKILKPMGKVFIAVPNYTAYDAKVYREYWAAYDVPRHLYHFSPRAMRVLLQQHGLKVQAVKPMWYDGFYVSMLSEQYKHGSAGYLKAFFTGMASNARAVLHKERCSSLIYIIDNDE